MNDRFKNYIAGVVVVSVVFVGLLISSNLPIDNIDPTNPTDTSTTESPNPNHSLEWSESTNYTLIYDIEFSYSGTDDLLGISTSYWQLLNDTEISAVYTSIPTIPDVLNFTLLFNLLGQAHLNITFTNQTSLESGSSLLRMMISRNTFPINDWEFVSSMFGDGWSHTYIGQYSTSTMYTFDASNPNYIEFKKDWSKQASGHGAYIEKIYGTINKSSGIPTSVFYRDAFSHVAGYWYEVTITLSDMIPLNR